MVFAQRPLKIFAIIFFLLLFFSIERDSRDVNQKMLDFRNQLLKARECVEKMPGIQYSRHDQLKQIDILQQQLTTKTQLIHKYKSMHSFDLAGQTQMQQ